MAVGYGFGGFFLSAAGIGKFPQPLTMALICAATGWLVPVTALGSALGYWAFWGAAGQQGALWAAGGCLITLLLGKRRMTWEEPMLIPAVAAFWVSVSGLAFQVLLEDRTPVPIYLLRVILAAVSAGARELVGRWKNSSPRGGTGMAQVRLEIMAGVLSQTQQLLLEAPEAAIDEDAMMARTRERACGSCPQRKSCTESAGLPASLLHIRLTDTGSLGVSCKKPGRLLTELRRSQEQLRFLRGQHQRQWELRQAVVQQYQFLSDYLRQQSDDLAKRGQNISVCFRVEAEILSYSKEAANGDHCQCFEGPGNVYYVALCDGMGTGMGAAQDGRMAITMLRRMLTAGFPAEYALRSLNSLCCLRERAGAVTVDLARIQLVSGRVDLYKWGAAPSWLLRAEGAEKIGTAGPPPGICVTQIRETVDRLSLHRGEVLILMSDGVEGEEFLRHRRIAPGEPLGEIAAKLLEWGSAERTDDGTVALIRLHPTNLST